MADQKTCCLQLFQVLEYRNDELQIQTSRAIQYNGDQLKALSQAASAENGFMTRLTYEIQNDSKFIKILTTIAMLYAPASLMAVCTEQGLRRRNTDRRIAFRQSSARTLYRLLATKIRVAQLVLP